MEFEPLISVFKQYYSHLRTSDVTYFEQSAEDGMSLPENVADLVICHNMLDHAINPDQVISECSRIAKSDACLLFSVNVYKDPDLKKGVNKVLHPHTFTEESARDILKRHDFTIFKEQLADQISQEGDYYFLIVAKKV